MKLGRACQITIGTNNVKESYEFYRLLGFRKIAENDQPYPWIKITDNSLVILLYQNGDSYIGLTYFDENMPGTIRELSDSGIRFVQRGTLENIFIAPTDTVVVLVKANHQSMAVPGRRILLDLRDDEFENPDKYPNPQLGIFGEFSHPVLDLQEAIDYWSGKGFEVMQQNHEPYPWALMYDGCISLGFHETEEFASPTITYFAPDVQQKVDNLQNLGIYGIMEYSGHGGNENNVVINTPEGQQLFLFQS